jgi:hypothetical protein
VSKSRIGDIGHGHATAVSQAWGRRIRFSDAGPDSEMGKDSSTASDSSPMLAIIVYVLCMYFLRMSCMYLYVFVYIACMCLCFLHEKLLVASIKTHSDTTARTLAASSGGLKGGNFRAGFFFCSGHILSCSCHISQMFMEESRFVSLSSPNNNCWRLRFE